MTEMFRDRPIDTLPWREKLRVWPAFIGYPRRAFAVVLVLAIVSTVSEGLGIALIYPIIEVMQGGGEATALADRSTLFGMIVDAFAVVGLSVTFETLLACVVVTFLARQVLVYAQSMLRARYGQRAIRTITGRTFGLFTQAGIPYTETLRSGTLINALFTEAKRAAMFAQALQNLLIGFFKFGFFAILLLFISWQATLIGAVVVGVAAYVIARRSVRGSKLTGQLVNEANDRVTRFTIERFSLFRLMKIQATEGEEKGLFGEQIRRLADLNVDIARHGVRIRTIIEGTVVLGGVAMIYLAHSALGMGLAGLSVFLVVLLRLLPVTQEVAVSRQQIAAYMHSILYLDRLSREAVAAREHDGGTVGFPGLRTALRFEAVDFTYPPSDEGDEDAPALHAITATIPAGRTTAILGPSGAGKSTLVDLIPRLREPVAGRILIDDVPLSSIRLPDLRRAIAMVSQDALVVDGTIAENLRYGCPEASDADIRAAAGEAHAREFIERLPAGYDTRVGERGVRLSGGQKQRLALARALIARAPLLILDEPTSALDTESEHAIQQALEALQKAGGVTILIIAHRLSTVRHADHIVVLDRGRVMCEGTHRQLMDDVPWYRKVVESQALTD